jgi:hypothetical protein
MQLPNPPEPEKFQAIENAIYNQRLARYAIVAGTTDKTVLFRFYLWNCALCEAFYFPLQIAEIITRNAIHKALLDRLGDRWFENSTFLSLLDKKSRSDLRASVRREIKQHKSATTGHHVCSDLAFGFWEHLTTKRFERLLWNRGLQESFPQAPPSATPHKELHALIESARQLRNRIAHHKAIFDKSPSRKYQDVLTLIRWVCNDTADWVTSVSTVQAVINARPDPSPPPS